MSIVRVTKEFDFVFSCPPYADLEVYSDLKGDISNMDYENFMKAYKEIIAKRINDKQIVKIIEREENLEK